MEANMARNQLPTITLSSERPIWRSWVLWGAVVIAVTGCASIRSDRSDAPKSISNLLQEAKKQDRALHIVYVHGMNAYKSGESDDFQRRLRTQLNLETPLPYALTTALNAGDRPSNNQFGNDIWDTDEKWERSMPFVRRRVHVGSDVVAIVDEINWWPLLAAVKCSRLVGVDVALSGTDDIHESICARSQTLPNDPYYPWPKSTGMLRMPPARINATLKHNLVTWGLSDAVLALGPLREPLRAAFNDAFDFVKSPSAEAGAKGQAWS